MKYNRNVYRAMTMITQFGVNMLVPIFLCSFVGYFLDGKLGTSYLMVVGFFIGAIAGGRNIYIFAKKIYTNKDSMDESYGSNRKRKSKDEIRNSNNEKIDGVK